MDFFVVFFSDKGNISITINQSILLKHLIVKLNVLG